MASVKKSRKIFSIVVVCSLMIIATSKADSPLPPLTEWVPDGVQVTVPVSRANPAARLLWNRKPLFRSTREREILGIEAELIFPQMERSGKEKYLPKNKLQFARSPDLSESCYYQDSYFLDPCENWTLGIDTSPECLFSALSTPLRIQYLSAPVPALVTSARYQVQTVGIDTGLGRGFTRLDKIVGPTMEAELIGHACTLFCHGCLRAADVYTERVLDACAALSQKWKPWADKEWLLAFCGECEDASAQVPAWKNFEADKAVCAEPVKVPGATATIGCTKPAYREWCDPINERAPQRICSPGSKRCGGTQSVEECGPDGLQWVKAGTCSGCCQGEGECGINRCTPSSSFCLNPTTRQTCSADGCASEVVSCPCGCDDGKCRSKACAASYCRDAKTLVDCPASGCFASVIACPGAFICKDGRCQDPPVAPPDMTSSPPPDMSAPPPMPETCNGRDDNGDGLVDNDPSCWRTINRFVSPASSYCFGPSGTAPAACAGYTFQRAAFVAATNAIPSSSLVVQCSKGTDHVLVSTADGDYGSLLALGYDCSLALGYLPNRGTAPKDTPYGNGCTLYRFRYTNILGFTNHVFTLGDDGTTGIICEPPDRFEAYAPSGGTCFSLRPSGC